MTDVQGSIPNIPLGFPGLRLTCMKIAKLLAQGWLDGPEGEEGRQFRQDVVTMELKEALKKHGIDLTVEDWLKFELDTDSYQGGIDLDESKTQEGLVFVWKIPFAPYPAKGITEEQIKGWISTCNDWIDRENYSKPEVPFPKPPNPYIPLATL